MALHLWYHDSDVGTIEITDHVKYGLGQIQLTMTAIQGTQDTNEIIVEDPDGIYNFKGLQIFFATEDEADFERIYTGQVWIRSVQRGDYYRTGPGRTWNLQIQNINSAFNAYVMTGEDDSRPAENDVERVQWLLGTNEASPFTDVTTYVFTDRPVAMDANPDPGYNGQMFNQVIDDASQQSGKNYYTLDYFDYGEMDYKQAVWYGHDDLDEFVSEATISNVLSEVDNVTVFWSDVAAKLDRDPSRVFSGIFANYDGGWVYRSRAQTITDFHHRDTVMSWPNVKTETKANARADRMLADLAEDGEEDTVTCTIYSMLPSQASVFRAGHRVNGVKFTHIPGWENGRDVRIVRRTLVDQAIGLYSMELEMLPIGPTASPSCTTSVSTAQETADIDLYPIGSGVPLSLPASAASFDNAVQVFMSAYMGPNMGLGGCTLTIGGGWSTLDILDNNGGNIWVANGYLSQPTSATPGNMTVTPMCTGGGPAEVGAHSFAFRSSSTAPVQQSALTGSGIAVLPDPPTVGNILVSWWVGSISGADTSQWLADGGIMLVDNRAYDVGIFQCMGIRCVTEDDTTDEIRIPAGSHANVGGVSEWLP